MENPYILVVLGLVFLFAGGEFLLRGAVQVAQKMRIQEHIIGLTVLGFGTSTPELLVSVQAALGGKPDIAMGNVIGSNIANILLIAGLSAAIMPIIIKNRGIVSDGLILIAISAILYAMVLTETIGRVNALILLSGLFIYLIYSYKASDTVVDEVEIPRSNTPVAISVMLLVFGFAGLFLGADWLVDGSSTLARQAGISEAAIGLTVVAVGTSLPELATSLIAAVRGKSDMAIANIIGSNIFNILAILGITGLIAPIAVSDEFVTHHVPVMLAVTFAFVLVLILKKAIPRLLGIIMLITYCAYIWSSFA